MVLPDGRWAIIAAVQPVPDFYEWYSAILDPVTGEAIGHAKPNGDELPFLFKAPDGSVFQTTFAYKKDTDTWQWLMDAGPDGSLQPFARLTLTRK